MPIAINGSGSITGLTKTGISAQPVFPGNVIQVVNYQTSTLDTGTQTIPLDNTIPQNIEGNQYMSLAITPTSSSSKLLIQSNAFLSHSATASWIVGALFQDSITNASAVTAAVPPVATAPVIISFNHYMIAGTTSSITFKFRAGGHQSGTTTFNGSDGNGYYGGTISSSLTIMEIAA